jgi:hypothetical protein|tara:strand:+ start:1820 stop:2569 length:750 start_codon:yes stop_codon:yes gene_type:complete
MSTRDIVQDVVKHTAGLGFITSVKVTGTDESTTLDAMDADRTVILQAKLHNAVTEFNGEFGLGNLGFLAGVSALQNYQAEDATVDVVSRERNGVQVPDHLMFKDKDGNTDQYRFMSKEIIEQTLQTVKFKGVEWDVTFEPTKAKVAELQAVAGIYGGIEPNFTVKTVDGNLVITVGAADGSFTGKRTFAMNVNGEITEGYAWPLNQVLAILKLGMSGACVMQISKKGALMISVDSGIGKYDYILPALTV